MKEHGELSREGLWAKILKLLKTVNKEDTPKIKIKIGRNFPDLKKKK